MTTHKPTNRVMISWALELLQAGILASAIPNRLMEEYGLTPEHAGQLAGEAIRRSKITPTPPPPLGGDTKNESGG